MPPQPAGSECPRRQAFAVGLWDSGFGASFGGRVFEFGSQLRALASTRALIRFYISVLYTSVLYGFSHSFMVTGVVYSCF